MIIDAVLDRVSVWRDRRETQKRQLQAAEEFVWVWSDTVDPECRPFGADLNCAETNTLADLFRVFNFWNTANQLMREHIEADPSVCDGSDRHPALPETDED